MEKHGDNTKILNFKYSFGYDSQCLYNLCVCDENVISWASGSIITFYNVIKEQRHFHKSSTGGSIGHIVKNSTCNPCHIAVGQGGTSNSSPLIEIFEWPSMKVVVGLNDGTTHTYSHLTYSHDGKLLASLGGAPDYNLTIWNWEIGAIKLRTNAFSYSVYNVTFSPHVPEQLITSGVNHIRFWKMATTFTGLKLKAVNGRFGKTDICDILGILPLPDEKVLSGCSWGNILVWESGTIITEIFRKGRQTCHQGPITQILYSTETDEITTISLDGRICTWYWNPEEITDVNEDNPFFELNPVTETIIPDAQLICIELRRKNEWFAQDISGAIWILKLESDNENKNLKKTDDAVKIINSHGGAIAGIASLRCISLLVSLGFDGSLLIHKLPSGPIVYLGKYPHGATCMYYMPEKIDKTGKILVLGFENGCIRLIMINTDIVQKNESKVSVVHLQILKPHTKKVKTINTNENLNFLLTSSEDFTIFLYNICENDHNIYLSPLYYITVTSVVNSINWKPCDNYTILMACEECLIVEAKLQKLNIIEENVVSYEKQFDSVCSTKLKNICLRKHVFENNDDIFEDNSEPNIELVEIDENSTKSMIWAKYDPKDTSHIWTAQEGCNCLMQIKPGETTIKKYVYLNGNFNDSITSHLYIDDYDHFIVGMSSGELSFFKMPDEFEDKSLIEFEQLMTKLKEYPKKKKKCEPNIILVPQIILKHIENIVIHDSQRGKITEISINRENKFLYTAGEDGNIFSFSLNFDLPKIKSSMKITDEYISVTGDTSENIFENGDQTLSHEKFVQEKERNALMQAISLHKEDVMKKLNMLKFEIQELLQKNILIPIRQQIQMREDKQVQEHINFEIEEKMLLIRRRLAYTFKVSSLNLKKMIKRNIKPLEIFPFQINSILNDNFNVKTIRQKKLPRDFFNNLDFIRKQLLQSTKELRKPDKLEIIEDDFTRRFSNSLYLSTTMQNILSFRPSHTLTIAIRNYLQRLERKNFQENQWQEHMKKKFKENQVPSLESSSIEEDEKVILGEYYLKNKLKTIPILSKYQILLDMFITRKEIYDIQHEYNNSLITLRKEKLKFVEEFDCLNKKLKIIRSKLPPEYISPMVFPIPLNNDDLEYPEKNLELKDSTAERTSNFKTQDPDYDETHDDPHHEKHVSVLLVEQDNMLGHMKYSIEKWEKSLKESGRSRERIILHAQFLRLHLLSLTQEKLILDSFEFNELKLSQNLQETKNELQTMNNRLAVLQKEIDNRKSIISTCFSRKKDLFTELKNVVDSSPYSAFLKRVFKKKSKSSDSLSSKSTSSEEDYKINNDDGDTGRIRLDSNTCPPGCDPQIYEETMQLRSLRYQLEIDIEQQNTHIIMAKNVILEKTNEISYLSCEVQKKQNDLDTLLKEKQLQLNDIDCVVILNADQCRFDALEELRAGREAIIFPATSIEALQHRVQQLLKEAEEQRKLYNMSKEHLEQMKGDCTFMNQHIYDLKRKIQKVLEQKLGFSQKLSKLNYENAKREASKILDNVLEHMVNEFRLSSATGLTKDMQEQLGQWTNKQYELERQYCCAIHEHTARLRTATVLQAQLLSNQESKKSNKVLGEDLEQVYKKDLNRLQRINKRKQNQIEDLKAELQRLKLKPYKSPILPPINGSSAASIVETPPPSELPLEFSNTRFMAMSLAKELNNVSYSNNIRESDLMTAMGEVLPLLIEGKMNVNQAADIIFEKLNSTKSVDDTNVLNDRSKHSIAEILNQITKHNLGDEITTNLELDKLKEQAGKEFQYVIKGLLDAGVTPEDAGAIDVAVTALIDIAPYFIAQRIDLNSVIETMQDETDCDVDAIKDLVMAVTDCLSAQSVTPTEISSIAAEFLKELHSSLVNDNDKNTNNETKTSNLKFQIIEDIQKKPTIIKKVSLPDVQNKEKLMPSRTINERQSSNSNGNNSNKPK